MSITVFGAGWCNPCKALKLKLDAANLAYQYIDVESAEGMEAMDTYGIRGVPTTLIKDNTGDVIKLIVGNKPIEEYRDATNS